MVGYTKVILMGNLTRDPELRTLSNGTAVTEIGMACNRRYTQAGEQKEQTCFVDVRFYGRQAEVIEQYLHKGNPLFVEGRLEFASWTAQDGSRRSKHRVVGESFQFLAGRQSDREGGRPERPERSERSERSGQGGHYHRAEPQPAQPESPAPEPQEPESYRAQENSGYGDPSESDYDGMRDVPF